MSVPCVHVIAYGPGTGLVAVAAEAQLGEPLTPEVASVSPFTKPLSVAVKAGFASPYSRFASRAVTVRCAGVTVSAPDSADVTS